MNSTIELKNEPSAAALRLIEYLFHKLSEGCFLESSSIIDQMTLDFEFNFLSQIFLKKLSQAILKQDWNSLHTHFINKDFISDSGYLIWIAPYSIKREGHNRKMLTGLFARTLSVITPNDLKLSKYLGRLQKNTEIPNEIICVESLATFGFTGSESGEAFLVPNGWDSVASEFGSAINDLRQQRERFLKLGQKVIQKIFEPNSAKFLLEWSKSKNLAYQVQSFEYQFHEYGHFTGISLKEKINKNLLICPWFAAVEEWRADGVAFDLTRRCLSEADAANVICANLCLRFGIDAQRAGGIENDTDANSCLILFDRMLKQGSIQITNEHQLRLNINSVEDILDCISSTSADTISITQEESQLQDHRAIWNLYGGVQVSPISRNLFELYVRTPCQQFENNLR
jgi:hypothetical protein